MFGASDGSYDDDGRVVEAGSHEELGGGGGLYAHLYGIQSRAYA